MTKILRSAAVVTGVQVHMIFVCNDCRVVLGQPVEKTGLYVLRDMEPVLICPECARADDLYIWGDPELLDRQDWTPEMLKAEQEKKDAEVDGNKFRDNPTPT